MNEIIRLATLIVLIQTEQTEELYAALHKYTNIMLLINGGKELFAAVGKQDNVDIISIIEYMPVAAEDHAIIFNKLIGITLVTAARYGKVRAFHHLFKHLSALLVDHQHIKFNTFLQPVFQAAVDGGCDELIQYIIALPAFKAILNRTTPADWHPLFYAARTGNVELFLQLVSLLENPTSRVTELQNGFRVAVKFDQCKLLAELTKLGEIRNNPMLERHEFCLTLVESLEAMNFVIEIPWVEANVAYNHNQPLIQALAKGKFYNARRLLAYPAVKDNISSLEWMKLHDLVFRSAKSLKDRQNILAESALILLVQNTQGVNPLEIEQMAMIANPTMLSKFAYAVYKQLYAPPILTAETRRAYPWMTKIYDLFRPKLDAYSRWSLSWLLRKDLGPLLERAEAEILEFQKLRTALQKHITGTDLPQELWERTVSFVHPGIRHHDFTAMFNHSAGRAGSLFSAYMAINPKDCLYAEEAEQRYAASKLRP